VLTACANSTRDAWSPAGNQLSRSRLHLHYGPIDLIIDVDASESSIAKAHQAARQSFEGVLEDLVSELGFLRKPVTTASSGPDGLVAKRMWRACVPHAKRFVTPMAAVAGAVADHTLNGIIQAVPKLNRVWVNNGGDIALMLSEGQHTRVGVCQNSGERSANILLRSTHGVGGIATSGWRGRSHSLGIADAVTVLAPSAAVADVAATLIANAVRLPNDDLDKTYITRTQAKNLQPDSDLAERKVTVDVSPLSAELCDAALRAGLNEAQKIITEAPVVAVFIECQGRRVSIGECT